VVHDELDEHHGARGVVDERESGTWCAAVARALRRSDSPIGSVHDERPSPLVLVSVSPFLARVLPAPEVAKHLERADDWGCLRESVLSLWNQRRRLR
jgi:hypothetical protein